MSFFSQPSSGSSYPRSCRRRPPFVSAPRPGAPFDGMVCPCVQGDRGCDVTTDVGDVLVPTYQYVGWGGWGGWRLTTANHGRLLPRTMTSTERPATITSTIVVITQAPATALAHHPTRAPP